MHLTNEQLLILNTNENLVINAVAGSGKTTTLIEYARTREADTRILYIAFNKTVKTEAQHKFKSAGVYNVQVETAHSLAYSFIMKSGTYKISQGYKIYEWRDILAINTGGLHTDYILASHISRFITYFCNSNATRVQDLNYLNVVTDPKAKTFVQNFYKQLESYTRTALAKMDKGDINVIHDFYLKKFQLQQPVLKYDYILFDEGQDASPAMLDIFMKQAAIKIIVGDVHQQIYGWRFAINSIQSVDFPEYHLSHSFRFNDEVALVANKVLRWKTHLKQEPATPVIGVGPDPHRGTLKAILGRSNLSLLLHAIMLWQKGEINKLYFEGHINSYTFAEEGASIYDVLHLYNGNHSKIRDRLIAAMENMKELEDYIQKTEDSSLSIIVELVKEFGNRLPGLIDDLKNHHTNTKQEADMIFSTVHRCKGMEYDEVTLLNDFVTEEKLKKSIEAAGIDKISEYELNRMQEEVNILYVAVTRVRHQLNIPPEINPLQTVKLARQYQYDHKPAEHKRSDRLGLATRTIDRNNKRGTKWSDEDAEMAETMFHSGSSIKEIAKALKRGEAAVQIKLANMGLIKEGDDF